MKNKYEMWRERGSRYAETIILSLFGVGIITWLTEIPDILTIISYTIFLVAYVAWSITEYIKDNKPCGTRISLHVLFPLALGGALFLLFLEINRYKDPNYKIDIKELLDSKILIAFVVLCIVFSFTGAIIYRIVRVITNPKKQVVYTATCIPIRKEGNNGIKFCLIKNKSHTASQWMFPGGHVNIENNPVAKNDNKCLKKLHNLPSDIAIEKCLDEANIEIKYIDFVNNKLVDKDDLVHSEECSQAIAPVFNMKFLVSENAKCFEQFGHQIHYDFTYVAQYTKGDNGSNYEYTEAIFQLGDYSFDGNNNRKEEEISRITLQLNSSIGRGDKFKQFFSSIPLLIYETLKLFNNNAARISLL